MPTQIGCQLYTLREFTKTPADIAKTLARVRKIGYEAVQVSAIGKIEPEELAKILKNEGLICAATHTAIERLEKEPQKVIDEHNMWGCKYIAIGGYHPKEATTQTWIDFADKYNKVIKPFKDSGISLGYHNHNHELSHYDDKPALTILWEHFDTPIWMEVDVYWITAGGGDPAQWIEKFSGRIHCVHLKDMGVKLERTIFMAEVGEGNLNMKRILATCKEAGVKWHLVEQDICYRDPFDSIELSLKHLHEMGLT